MRSRVLDGATAGALDLVAAGVDALVTAGVEPFDPQDAITSIRELEVQVRRLRALQVEQLSAIDRRGLHRLNGHASAKVMVRHCANLSNTEAARRNAACRALRDLPEVRAAFVAGRVGVDQVDRMARAHANPRVREHLCEEDGALANLAARESYVRFDAQLTDWTRRVDEDGTCDRARRHHQNRDAKIVQDYDSSWTLTGGCGSLQGLELHEIWRRFVEAEFATDWEKARIDHGDSATVDHLARTDNQRRFDALFEIFQRAASSHADSVGGSVIVTDVVIDQATFERHLRRHLGADPGPVDVALDPAPGTDRYRSSSLDGRPVDPAEAVAAAVIGRVRRVVVGADSVVIDLGRRQRLFTGPAALAVRLAESECYWPGCHVPATACQIDHLVAWADYGGGSTNPHNGGPACGRHNRLKQWGFTVHRDPTGHWHTHRPDGTEIE